MMNAVRFFLVLFLVLALLATGYLIDIDDAAPNGIIPKPGHLSSEGRGAPCGAFSVINLAHYLVAQGREEVVLEYHKQKI